MGLVPEHAGYPVPVHLIWPSTGVPSVLQQTQSSISNCITKNACRITKTWSVYHPFVGVPRLTHQSSPIAWLSVPTAGWSNPSRFLVSYIPSSSHHHLRVVPTKNHFLHPEEKQTLLVCSNIISYNVRPPSYELVYNSNNYGLWYL